MIDQSSIDYLTQLDSREGLFLWMVMLIAFLFGFLIAYLLRSGKVRKLKKENAQIIEEKNQLQILLTNSQEQLKERNAELQQESREKVDLMDRVTHLEQQRQQQLQEVVLLNQQLEEVQSTNRTYMLTIDDVNSQLAELKAQNEQPGTNPQHLSQANSASSDEVSTLRDRLNAFESALTRLETENAALKSDLTQVKVQQSTTSTAATVATSEDKLEPSPQIQSDKTVLFEKIIISEDAQDDLTKIKGLGAFIAKKLNANGISSYAEIANWTPGRIAEVTELIGYIPGRIEKDDWVGQAARLLQQNTASTDDNPKKKGDSAPKGKKETDLKIIEGIGPKIEEVLHNAGIMTWADLAATEPGKLKEVLEAAGDRFRMHNPYTWPLQARLAAAGRWDEFNGYQEELKGGRE